jgi:acyl dehydratase
MEQLYYEDVPDGSEIPMLEAELPLHRLVMYCGTYEDFGEMHYDAEAAARIGFPKVVVPGHLTTAFLARLLARWITPEGRLKYLRAAYRQPLLAGDTARFKGRVTGKRVENGEHFVDCEIWAEGAEGTQRAAGVATIALPSREG